ncbi:hypothetical protein ASG90_03025 [Nocardioides sp. Soil797]|nr:hypothetical protein ASG90_03025 [Nocardioides sp. Soil797]
MSLAAIVLPNVIALWLVLTGQMATADLLMAYVVDAWLAMVLLARTRRRAVDRVRSRTLSEWLALIGGVLLLLLVVGVLSAEVIATVSWDRASVLAILSVCVCQALGLRWNRRMGWGGLLWRILLLLIGAGIGLGTARGYARLAEHGWEPARLGDAWAGPLGETLTGWMLDLHVPAMAIPALMLITYRTANELVLELGRVDDPEKGSGASARPGQLEGEQQHQEAGHGQGHPDVRR